jgi:predicted permease
MHMPWIQRIWLRLQSLFSRRRALKQLDNEMQFHLEQQVAENIAAGMEQKEARQAALRIFGNATLLKEQTVETWGWSRLDEIEQDFRYAFRAMRRDIGSTVFAIVIAGIGIGAGATVFSVVNALLLRPLPFRDSGKLVWISNGENYSTQAEHYADLREENRSLVDLAGWCGAYREGDKELTGAGEPERLTSVPVTENFFPLLGVEPAMGRSFTKEECEGVYSAPPAMLLSHRFWQKRFASDPNVIGRKLTLNNQLVIVVGVLPKSFDFASIFAPGIPVDCFIPWPLKDKLKPTGNTMPLVGRLKPGATIQSAQAEFSALAKQFVSEHPERNSLDPRLVSLERHVSGQVRPALVALMCAVGTVMLIVCANLSHLQIARVGARRKEMAIRAALGARRSRLLRQMLTESVMLSCFCAALGIFLAIFGTRQLVHFSALNLPLLGRVQVDGGTLAFILLATIALGVVLGLAPALQIPIDRLRDALQEGGRDSSGSSRHGWVHNGLVISEFALACVLLVGAGLIIQSFLRVLDVNLGFQPERAAALRIDPSFRISSFEQQNVFIDEALHRVRSVPGVMAAGIADVLPLKGDRSWQVSGQGQVWEKDRHPEAFIRVVSDGYFAALEIPLKSGRAFAESDRASSEPVAMVNETLARTLWPGQNPIGQMMTQDGGRLVIGVVGDVHHGGPERSGGPEMYLPMRQSQDYQEMELIVRTTLAPDALARGIRAALRPIDPNLPVTEFQTMQDLVDKVVSPRRFLVLLLGGFAGFALLIASLGIYALISHTVNRRTREIGICMALGASAGFVQREVLAKTIGLAGVGAALGTLASFGLTKWIESLLFGTKPTDPVIFSSVILLLCAVSLAAGYLPARRASRIDPMIALRSS